MRIFADEIDKIIGLQKSLPLKLENKTGTLDNEVLVQYIYTVDNDRLNDEVLLLWIVGQRAQQLALSWHIFLVKGHQLVETGGLLQKHMISKNFRSKCDNYCLQTNVDLDFLSRIVPEGQISTCQLEWLWELNQLLYFMINLSGAITCGQWFARKWANNFWFPLKLIVNLAKQKNLGQ